MTKRFAVVRRPDNQGDVIGKFDQKGSGTIYIGGESDTVGEDIVVIESNKRSHIEIPIDTVEDWWDTP